MMRLALIVPARNAESVIGRLLDSVAAQTVPFDEVIVYDDASTDWTAEIARSRGARVVRSDVNTGPSVGKNRLASETTCDWVHFHDADDALHPEFVARARTWMNSDAVDVVLFATEDRDDRFDRTLAVREWDDRQLGADPIGYAIRHTITNCGIYRRQAFLDAGGFNLDPAVAYNEDQAMHVNLALAGLRFRSDTLPGVIVYQRHGSMSSSNRIGCARAQIEVLAIAAARTGDRRADVIGARLWRLAGECAGYADWPSVYRALDLAAGLGYRDPHEEQWLIRLGAQLSPRAAVTLREALICIFKPHLRIRMPSAAVSRRDTVPLGIGRLTAR